MLIAAAVLGYLVTIQLALAATARLSGWAALAAAHPCDGDCPKPARAFQSVRFGALTSYNACVSISTDKYALHLTPWRFLLRPTHKPVALWWKDVVQIRRARGVVKER
jgi:hypothetical protein